MGRTDLKTIGNEGTLAFSLLTDNNDICPGLACNPHEIRLAAAFTEHLFHQFAGITGGETGSKVIIAELTQNP